MIAHMMRFASLVLLLSLTAVGCALERQSVRIPSTDRVREIVAETVHMPERTRSGRKKLTGKKCRDLLTIIQACNKCQVIGASKDNSSTIIQVSSAYNGTYAEITLPVSSGQIFSLTVNAEEWNKIQGILNGNGVRSF